MAKNTVEKPGDTHLYSQASHSRLHLGAKAGYAAGITACTSRRGILLNFFFGDLLFPWLFWLYILAVAHLLSHRNQVNPGKYA